MEKTYCKLPFIQRFHTVFRYGRLEAPATNKKEGKETCDVTPTLSRLGDNPAASRNCRTVIFYLSIVVAEKNTTLPVMRYVRENIFEGSQSCC